MENNVKIQLKQINNVSNPLSIHGIYPYRGKISSIDAKNIINQLPQDGVLLDPFCGSGTIIYEAAKHGLTALGIDNNPLAIEIAKAKSSPKHIDYIEKCEKIIEQAKSDLEKKNFVPMPENALKSFEQNTAAEIMCVKNYYNNLDDYLKGAFLGAIALAARGCNGYKWTSTTVGKNIEPKTYVNFFDKFKNKVKKHESFLHDFNNKVSIIHGDSRKLSDLIKPKSVDFVFTSPPYFDGLDYTAYYGKLIYEIFNVDRNKIKKELIQTIDSYKADMEVVLKEIDKITKDNALIIFVVGDKKVKDKIINGGEFFNGIKKASYIMERGYTGSSSKVFDVLNNTNRKEQIVVWEKTNGEVKIYD